MDGLVCSHRGPFTYADVNGRIEERPGNGGLVNAVSGLLRGGDRLAWLACALSELDREVAHGRRPAGDGRVGARLLDIPAETHRLFYDEACVTGLGFLFHGLVDQTHTPTFDARLHRAWAAYREVNRAYAREVAKTAVAGPVFVEDYHLMFVADALREIGFSPPGPTVYFHHVPWCAPAYFALLPRATRTEVLSRLLAFDALGFHARMWADAFVACCAAFLPGAECEPGRVRWRDRETPIVVAPAQVDVPHLRQVMASDAAERWRDRLARLAGGRRVIVRVDRVDLWKNVIRGFAAFERLVLDGGAPGTVFVALLVRSRTHLPEYRRYLAACRREAGRVNERLDPYGPGPIHLLVAGGSEHARALAGLGVADVALVNSTSDGLNLVAKETAIAGEGRTRLVLSETTGAHEQLGAWAHTVHPFDIGETAGALAAALAEDGAPGLRGAVLDDSPESWIRRRLAPVSSA